MKKLSLLAIAANAFLLLNAQSSADTSFKKYEQPIPGSSLKFTMLPIPAGTFTMGSSAKDKMKEEDETPQRAITLSPFWMGAYEVTFDEFNLFFNDGSLSQNIPTDAVTRPSSPYIDMTLGMGKEGGFPANSMQQFGALMYCKWLYKKTGIFFRLPTEAEWEYACRAGTTTIYPFGDDASKLDEFAWYAANSGDRYHKVGQKKPNARGLYDMLGNVGEWVLDQYQPDYYTTLTDKSIDPVRIPDAKHPRTVKGGAYNSEAKSLRSADRLMSDKVWNRRDPQIPKSKWWNADSPFVGFRIVRPVKQPTPEEADTFFKTYLGL
ncbi:MAG TPA: SUMF1/EgtB/PvdO family nonheme iron enzyme [Chitinophagaceae bacterium]|nr:SUMF1/EgtB/PvdO family nonheme iron enzyme [Chitinophagaceae bacterium]